MSPTLVGAFVVGAVVIALLGLLSLGSGPILADTVPMVAVFRASVAGLDVGAPVRFRGVGIGRVVGIHAQWNEEAESVLIPVELEVAADGIRVPGRAAAEVPPSLDSAHFLEHLVELGLRAELQYDSYVTNKLFVAFDFHPETAVELTGVQDEFEMPTVQTGLERLKQSLEELPLEALVDRAMSVVVALETLLSDPRIGLLLDDLRGAATEAEALARLSQEELATLVASGRDALESARAAVVAAAADMGAAAADVRTTVATFRGDLEPLSGGAVELVGDLRAVAARLEEVLAADPHLAANVSSMLAELTATARAVRRLAEFLERNPESLLRGRRNP